MVDPPEILIPVDMLCLPDKLNHINIEDACVKLSLFAQRE